MSQRWIKMRADLPTDPAVLLIATVTKIDPLDVCGRLLLLWGIADAHADETKDGLMSGTPAMVDKSVRVKEFSAAMVAAGWLVFHEDDKMSFPHYIEHNGKTAKVRAQTQKRAVKSRSRNANVTQPKRTVRNDSVTRGEEIRLEEIREEDIKTDPEGTIDFSMVLFPDGFDQNPVRDALTRWGEYKTRRNQPLHDPEGSAVLCLQRFSAFDPSELIRQVNRAIESEWKSIPDPDPRLSPNGNGKAYIPTKDRLHDPNAPIAPEGW